MPEVLLTEIFPPRKGGSGKWLKEVYDRLDCKRLVVTDSLDDHELNASNWDDPSYVTRTDFSFRETGGFSPSGFKNYLKRNKELRGILADKNCSLIRAGRVLPEGWLAWIHYTFFRGPEYHIFAHGEEINLEGRQSGGVMSSQQHRIMAKIAFKYANQIIANSKNTASLLEYQWNINPEKITVANPGVDTRYFQPLPEDAAKDDTSNDITAAWNNRFVILTVGRLQKRKGQDFVLKAIQKLRRLIPNLLYVIVGNGEEIENLKRLTEELSLEQVVEFHTQTNDKELLRCYQLCDLFILANRQIGSDIEGFGMVLLEAAACGKATITGTSGGTQEAIAPDVTGLAIDASDINQIANAIYHLYRNPDQRELLGKAGRKRAVNEYDWENVLRLIPQVSPQ